MMFFMSDKLRSLASRAELVVGTLDADPDSIGELSLQLLERCMKDTFKLSGCDPLGRSGSVSQINIRWLITHMLDALELNNELYIPRDRLSLFARIWAGRI